MTAPKQLLSLNGCRIWIAGHRGMVGSALLRRLSGLDIELLTVDRSQLDLRNASAVSQWVEEHQPDVVIIAAAKVGGIRANAKAPAEFLFDNLAIQQNIISASAKNSVRKLLTLGSSCIYPKHAPQPIDVSQLLAGPLEATNQWYAVAKIAGIKLAEAFRQQYDLDFISAIPSNLYGPGDNFDVEDGHVIPSLLKKAHDAVTHNNNELIVWGSGNPLREFMHVDDLADALVHVLQYYSAPAPINIGTGKETSIRNLSEIICKITGFTGTVAFDHNGPDGTPRKLTECSPLTELGWNSAISLEDGLASTYQWFLQNLDSPAKLDFQKNTKKPSFKPEVIPQVKPTFGKPEQDAVQRVLKTGWITEGQECEAFINKFNGLTGANYGVFAPNGTMALTLGLMALGIGSGDEVLVPDITFVASATAVVMAGAQPVFVDVLPKSFQINVEDARTKITPRSKAIMPVHLYGSACDMQAVLELSKNNHLKVIEDAAQGVGVFFNKQHVGTMGDVGCFSFFADKTISTGEGGYVACKDGEVYERLRCLRNQGRLYRGSFQHQHIGFNFRLTDLQAAIGLEQLARLDTIISSKQLLQKRYIQQLSSVSEVKFLECHTNSTQVPFRTVILVENAKPLMAELERNNIQTRTFFYPLHRQPCFSDHPQAAAPFPNANKGYEQGICLPVYPTLSTEEVDFICSKIKNFYRPTIKKGNNEAYQC